MNCSCEDRRCAEIPRNEKAEGSNMGTWTTRLRVAAAGSAAIALVAVAVPAAAADEPKEVRKSSKQEAVGVATGVTIGALAGGPFGAVIGAAAGAWLGDRFHQESSGRKLATRELEASRMRNAQLAERGSTLDASLTAERARSTELVSLLDRVHELETDIAFRTEEATLSSEAAMRLHRLGTLLASMPETRVRVSGFADPRGAESFNLELSGRRAAAVGSELEKAGLSPDRLIVEAHGESSASSAEGDVDAQALERRVTVRLERAAVAVAQGGSIR
jgi:outer membrane protein OmpA-like peptidoglycan-associated protein